MEKRLENKNITFEFCDYADEYHCTRFAQLINQYIADPMGGGKPLSALEQLRLLDGMANHPSSLVVFALLDGEIAGLTTCFINFSTFKVKKYLYIHDIIVDEPFRTIGLGKKLMERCIEIAQERKYCKVTLEVREDNSRAKYVYQGLGFKATEPAMLFWTKEL